MLVKQFEYKEDSEMGTVGWAMLNAPASFNVGSGLGVAHDTLEHFHNTNATWEDELLALGSMVYIRGINGQLGNPYHTPAESLASDLINCLEFFTNSNRAIKPCTARAYSDGYDGYGLIHESVKLAAKAHVTYGDEWLGTLDELNELYKYMTAWLNKGYSKSKARYHYDNCSALTMFQEIRRKVDNIKYTEQGDTLKVIVNIKAGTTKVLYTSYLYLETQELR